MIPLSPLHHPAPRMKGVRSLPILGRPWLFQPRMPTPTPGQGSTNNADSTNKAKPKPKRLSYLYYRMHIVFIAMVIMFLTAVSIMISFGKFLMPKGQFGFDPIASESFQCTETSNMSSWIQTPVHDRRFFLQYEQLSEFLDGHASKAEIDAITSNDNALGAAICIFRTNIQYWNHFPHAYV
jgi:hypothetical protein